MRRLIERVSFSNDTPFGKDHRGMMIAIASQNLTGPQSANLRRHLRALFCQGRPVVAEAVVLGRRFERLECPNFRHSANRLPEKCFGMIRSKKPHDPFLESNHRVSTRSPKNHIRI